MNALRYLLLLILAGGLVVHPLAGAAGLAGYVLLSRPVRRWGWTTPTLAVGASALLAGLVSPWKLDALAGGGVVILLGVALVLAFVRFTVPAARWAATGAAAGLIAAAVKATFQVSTGAQALAFSYHPNVAAGLFLVGVFGTLGAFSRLAPRGLHGLPMRLLLAVAFAASLAGLAFTGSRSGVVGLAAGVVVMVPFAVARIWRRLGARRGGALLFLCAAALTALVITRPWAAQGVNLVVNSGFEAGAYPWRLAGGTSFQVAGEPGGSASSGTLAAVDGERFIRLSHDAAGWQALLAAAEPFPVEPTGAYALSLYVRPAPGGPGGTFVRVEARDSTGTFLARAGRDGWTTGDEDTAGGRWFLPTVPQGAGGAESPGWQRFVLALPPPPTGTAELTLTVANDSKELGVYGDLDALQLERGGEASPYVPGPSAGLRAYLGPLVPRLLAMRDPLAASGGRISMWYFSLQLARARPFLGYGFGVVEHLVRPEAPRHVLDPLKHPHSFYLELLLEGGALLLVSVMGLFALVAWWLLRRAARGSWAAAGALAALVALLVQSVFDPVLAQGPVLGLWWVIVCVAAAEDGATGSGAG